MLVCMDDDMTTRTLFNDISQINTDDTLDASRTSNSADNHGVKNMKVDVHDDYEDNDVNEGDDISITSQEEALNELLGIQTSILKTVKWVPDDSDIATLVTNNNSLTTRYQFPNGGNTINSLNINNHVDIDTKNNINNTILIQNRSIENRVMERAYHLTSNSIESPPVVIVYEQQSSTTDTDVNMNMEMKNKNDDKGNFLIAKQSFQKGQVIFTEKSLVAIQQPQQRYQRTTTSNNATTMNSLKHNIHDGLQIHHTTVRACQMCFKSLTPGSCLLSNTAANYDKNTNTITSENNLTIPYLHLWPIPEIQLDEPTNNDTSTNSMSNYKVIHLEPSYHSTILKSTSNTFLEHIPSGIIICTQCNSLFCSSYCAKEYQISIGLCCPCVVAENHAIKAFCSYSSSPSEMMTREDEDEQTDNNDDANKVCTITTNDGISGVSLWDDSEQEENSIVIDPVYSLATRMFCMLVNQFRSFQSSIGGDDDDDERGDDTTLWNIFDGNCGTEQDITPLQLGDCVDETESTTTTTTNGGGKVYSMSSGYQRICKALSLTETERQHPFLSLNSYHKLAAIAQRNGIHLCTSSPFRGYYEAMLRNTGGRGSIRQKEVSSQIAKILGASDGKISKDMDRIIEEKCVVQVCGVFTLAALMNHSCDPVAELRGGEYSDSRIDVVAKTNIEKGQEITISYIDLRSESRNAIIARNRRNRQLESKYLFKCSCKRCINM